MSEVLKETALVAGLWKGQFQEHELEPKGGNEHGGQRRHLYDLGSVFMRRGGKTESLFFLAVKLDWVVC